MQHRRREGEHTDSKDDLVARVLEEIGVAGDGMAAEGASRTVVQGTVKAFVAECLLGIKMVEGENKGIHTCWQGVVTGW